MKFSTDELMPFFEVRTGMSKHLDDVLAGKEIVITRHGKPEGALLSATRLFQYREQERIFAQLLGILSQMEANDLSKNESQITNLTEQVRMLGLFTQEKISPKELNNF